MTHEAPSAKTLETWALLAAKGDERAFMDLYDYFFDRIWRYVSFRVDSEEVEDLVSEIFYKCVKSLKQYKPQKKATFASWIFRIAHNQVVDYYRKQKELMGTELEEEFFLKLKDEKEPSPDQKVLKHEEVHLIHKLLKKLKPNHREILELKYLEEFSNAEIASITGKTEGNVRIIQLRALREMRKLLDEEGV